MASSQLRILEILNRLQSGEYINVEGFVNDYGRTKAQLQRDIGYIKEYLSQKGQDVRYIKEMGYKLTKTGDYFTVDDALIVLLLLYGSRALNKNEVKGLYNKLCNLFSSNERIKLQEFFKSYIYYYQPVQKEYLLELLYKCFQAISQKNYLKFSYTNSRGETGVREVKPITIVYHDKKFYLHASLKGLDDWDMKAFLVDRIEDCDILRGKFSVPYGQIKVGEYMHKAFYMYSGDLEKVKLKVRNTNIEYLKREFPVVEVGVPRDSDWVDVALEVYGLHGIMLWILKQGANVEVLEPLELREKVKQEIGKMHGIYFGNGGWN